MSNSKSAFEKIERHFTSGNSIEVERATILRSDWELAKQYMPASAQDGGEPVAWLCIRPDGEPWGAVTNQVSVDLWMRLGSLGRTVCPLYTRPPSAVAPEPFGTESAYQTAKNPILSSSNMIISSGLARDLVEALRKADTQQPSAVVPDDSKHHAVMQAQMWAQEARTQKAIVKQIGEIVGCANDWEMVEAVKAALASAVVPEDEVLLQDAANKICQHLPENMVLSLCMENGAAWVELGVDRIGNVKLPDSADKTLINQINDALCVAIGWNGDLDKQEQES
jgi:hypothetical protein